jgi:hypothetical protein
MRFAGGAAGRGALEEARADPRGPAMEPFGLEVEAIGGLLGDPWGGVRFGGAFEDLLPRRFEPGGQTLVEDDLTRRGGSAEAAAAKASRRALRASAVRLSEASKIVPGRSVLARDLVRGGEPGRVTTRVGAAW